jgi:hypothetical protein
MKTLLKMLGMIFLAMLWLAAALVYNSYYPSPYSQIFVMVWFMSFVLGLFFVPLLTEKGRKSLLGSTNPVAVKIWQGFLWLYYGLSLFVFIKAILGWLRG